MAENFGFAMKGIVYSLAERNVRIHYLAAIMTTITGLLLGISNYEWYAVLILFGLVISLEMVNTAIENIVDMVSPEFNGRAGKIKDIAAGAVLIAAIVAVIIALKIFVPKIIANIILP